MKSIPYGRHDITDEDIQAVVSVLKSDYLTQGPQIFLFEKAFAKYVGCEYAVAVSNGTAALHLCTLALGVRSGQKVITTPITFAASANCIRYCDGEVVFADINPLTYLIDIDYIESLLKSSPKNTFSGIISVDFAGRAVNLEGLSDLAKKYNMWVIEDACHAPGGYFINNKGNKEYCGGAKYADLAIFSFHPVKHIATGEGGMITTNNRELYERILTLRTHGITRDSSRYKNSLETACGNEESGSEWPGWYMEMQELGYNYRITDFQAALGLSQLSRADVSIERRKEIAKRYYEAFKGKGFVKGQSGVVEGHAYHLYIIEVNDRLGLYNHLKELAIFAQVHYIPCHLMPYYKDLGWKEGDMPHAEGYYKSCLSLPMYPSLTFDEQTFVIDSILNYYNS